MIDNYDDEQVLGLLRTALLESAAVTASDREAAQAAFAWQAVQAEVLQLLEDSALTAGALVRSSASVERDLSFGNDTVRVEVEVASTGTVRLINGQVIPGQVASITLEQPGGSVTTTSDEDGFFRFDDVVPGAARLTVVAGDDRFTTSWVTL